MKEPGSVEWTDGKGENNLVYSQPTLLIIRSLYKQLFKLCSVCQPGGSAPPCIRCKGPGPEVCLAQTTESCRQDRRGFEGIQYIVHHCMIEFSHLHDFNKCSLVSINNCTYKTIIINDDISLSQMCATNNFFFNCYRWFFLQSPVNNAASPQKMEDFHTQEKLFMELDLKHLSPWSCLDLPELVGRKQKRLVES